MEIFESFECPLYIFGPRLKRAPGNYWEKTTQLVCTILFFWCILSMVIPSLVHYTNDIKFLSFPLGYYMPAQGSILGFVALIFLYNKYQTAIDNEVSGEMDEAKQLEGSAFLQKLNKIYGWYVGGFAVFVLFMGILEAAKVDHKVIGYFFVAFTIIVYAGIGIMSRTKKTSEYYVAGQKVPAIYNGMATAADWMSGASFVGMAGKVYYQGYDGLAFVMGWTGGYVVVATLIAPYLRKYECYTVPDFLGARYAGPLFGKHGGPDGGKIARVIGIIVLLFASFSYLTAQVYSTGIIMSRFLDIDLKVSCFIGLAGILFCSMLGGMKGVTWTQVAQYVVLIVAYCIPVFWMSLKREGDIIPQISYGPMLSDIAELEKSFEDTCYMWNGTDTCLAEGGFPVTVLDGGDGLTLKGTLDTPKRLVDWWMLTICLMLGTASLPHVLMRYFTTPSVQSARKSVGWSCFFIMLLYITAPCYAAFAKENIFKEIIGTTVKNLPDWIFTYGKIGLVKICGGETNNLDDAVANCGLEDYRLQVQDYWMNTDVVVIATPEANGLPYTIAALTAAGGLAASLSTADGLLLAMANSLSHDLYFKMINPNASPMKRLLLSRIILVIIAVLCAFVASDPNIRSDILVMVAWAFSLAAAGNFPALFLGVWWKRTTALGVVCGMTVGFLITLIYIFGTHFGDWEKWGDVANISAAIFGLPIGFVITVVVSLLSPPPTKEMTDWVVSLREPEYLIKKNKEADAEQPTMGTATSDGAEMTSLEGGENGATKDDGATL